MVDRAGSDVISGGLGGVRRTERKAAVVVSIRHS